MTFNIQNFTSGAFKSSFNHFIFQIKKHDQNKRLTIIDLLFRPVITCLSDTVIAVTDLKKMIKICNENKILNQNSRRSTLIFLTTKTCLNMSLSLFENLFSRSTKQAIEKIHNILDAALPIISAIVAIASLNLMFIAGYFLQLSLINLANNYSIGTEIQSICHYTSFILCLSSILNLNATSSIFFQKGIKLQL
jgi:hypothetical protein